MLMCRGDLAAGLSKKQSLLAPDSSRPFGVTMRRGVSPFCSSSHISAMDSLYPPPQSSTDSPRAHPNTMLRSHNPFTFFPKVTFLNKQKSLNLPTNLTFHTRCGNRRLSGLKELIFAHICPNTDFVPSGPARPPLLRERLT